jgi:hypothetical protein
MSLQLPQSISQLGSCHCISLYNTFGLRSNIILLEMRFKLLVKPTTKRVLIQSDAVRPIIDIAYGQQQLMSTALQSMSTHLKRDTLNANAGGSSLLIKNNVQERPKGMVGDSATLFAAICWCICVCIAL